MCACRDHYVGDFCESALAPGFAPAYVLSGCAIAAHCGMFRQGQ